MNAIQMNTDPCRQLMAWLRGGDTTPDPVMEQQLNELLSAVVVQCVVENRKEIQRLCTAEDRRERRERRPESPLSIKAMMKEMGMEYDPGMFGSREKAEVPDDIGDLPESEPALQDACLRDSLTFAKALVHMAEIEDRGLNMSQIQVILYIAYGVWMAENGDRLFDEHPQAWQYGPVFPRVYSKLKKDMTDTQELYLKLMDGSPERFAFLERCFRRYAWTRASDLAAPHISKGTPWSRTRKSNPDSQTARIDDSLVAEWFSERISPAD